MEFVVSRHREVRCVWVGAGVFHRGQFTGYEDVLKALIADNPNLYVTLTPELITGQLAVPPAFAINIATSFPERVLLGTTIKGNFTANPAKFDGEPKFGGKTGAFSYSQQCATLISFLDRVEEAVRARSLAPDKASRDAEAAYARARLRFANAGVVYNLLSEEEARAVRDSRRPET